MPTDEAHRRSWCGRRRRHVELLAVHELGGNFALADAHLAECGAAIGWGPLVGPDQGIYFNEVDDSQGDHDAGVLELLLVALLGLVVGLVVLLVELVQGLRHNDGN